MIIRVKQTTMLLPNPQLGDSERLTSSVTHRRSMSGKHYTYVKRSNRRLFTWTFMLTELKAAEFIEFARAHHAETWTVTDYNGRIIRGKCKTNPVSANHVRRNATTVSNDLVQIDIEFEGVVQ